MRAALCESTITVRSIAMPLALRIDQEQRQARRARRRARGARRHDQEIGDVAVDHEGLVAVEPESRCRSAPPASWSAAGDAWRPRRWRARRAASRRRSSADTRTSARRCRRATAPTAASTAVERNGDGIRVRPISSITTPASTQPSPLPPNSSGTSRPENPISAKAFHSSRENPVGVLGVAQLPQMRHRRLVADQPARAVAQHRLFFGKDECHLRDSVQ